MLGAARRILRYFYSLKAKVTASEGRLTIPMFLFRS